MIHPIRKYRALSYEQRTVVNTIIGLCFSTVLAGGKLAIGLFTDYNLVSIAIYTLAILFAKYECILGIKSDKKTFIQRNRRIAAFLFVASAAYIGFMCRMFFTGQRLKSRGMLYVLLLATISFCELGFAIAGLYRTKHRGYFYRDIKIINFCVALIAILTTQMSILNLKSETGDVSIFNAYTGVGVGCFIALCAVYILIAPKASVIGREHNKFLLQREKSNRLVDFGKEKFELVLCRSNVYGDYIYRAKVCENTVEGDIVRGSSLWQRMPIVLKIGCCILSEILVFPWLIGRAVLFFRSVNLPARLERTMNDNGFVKADEK